MKFLMTLALISGACGMTCTIASAQSADFSLAHVTHAGTTTHSIAGSGSVTVQVQVNADGSHKAIRVIRSTNSGDNAAALDIAQSATYRAATRGGKAVTSYYDYILRFNGKMLVNESEGSSGGAGSTVTGAGAPIAAAIRAKQYSDAVSKANAALLQSPGNPEILQLLGIAQYYNGDLTSSAQAFSRVDTIDKPYQVVAADALAGGAVKVSSTDPTSSLAYAKKADAMADNDNSKFALGVANIANKNFAAAIPLLKAVRDDAKDNKTKAAADQQLLLAYQGSYDTADAAATMNDLKSADPNAGSVTMGNYYINEANTDMNAKNFDAAVKAYDQAIALGGVDAVTANASAAFAVMQMSKPDYARAQKYALAAVAGNPNDAAANFAAGASTLGVYSTSHSADDKNKAQTYLQKADQLAKAAGNTGLSLQIENQLKQIPQ